MRSQQHIRNDGSRYKLGTLLFHAAIDVAADVAVRPAVKTSVFQGSEIVRRQIVTQFVALVNGRPHFARHRFKRQTHRIPEPRCVAPRIHSIGIA